MDIINRRTLHLLLRRGKVELWYKPARAGESVRTRIATLNARMIPKHMRLAYKNDLTHTPWLNAFDTDTRRWFCVQWDSVMSYTRIKISETF